MECDQIVPVMEKMKREGEALPSPFEIETALSFLYYREKKCDLVLLECGMGGKNRCHQCDRRIRSWR